MKTKRFLIFAACCLLSLTLAGCGSGRVESTASRLGDDVSNAISRVESALDPDDNASSGLPDESQQSSMPGYSSSQAGDPDGGDGGLQSGLESDGQASSDLNGDSSTAGDESSRNTKDL